MGLSNNNIEFTLDDIKNKKLILDMLKFEDILYLSNKGQQIIKKYGKVISNLEASKIIQRNTLEKFNFISSDNSLKNYRKIFQHYYISSTNYDDDVLQSVYYMRENRCLYYIEPELNIGDKLPDVELFNLDGTTKNNLYNILDNNDYNNCIIAAFSLS
jgi:hypothetical protein